MNAMAVEQLAPWDAGAIPPWERQPGEGAKPYAAFCIYRDAGPTSRSTHKVSAQFTRSWDLIRRWSAKWNWIARARAWDAENDRVARVEQVKGLKDMARRRVLIGMLMQSKLQKRITAENFDTVELPLLSWWELLRINEQGVRLEGEGRGIQDAEAAARGGIHLTQVNIGAPSPATQIIALLKQHPERIGPAMEAWARMTEVLPELNAGPVVADDEGVLDEDEEEA